MHRLIRSALIAFALLGCAKQMPVVKDPPAVEAYRARITKVRHAQEETRSVLAASNGDPYQAELTMRLAELISEEARYHYLVAAERESGRVEALHLPQVRILKEQAIATYRSLIERHPESELAERAMFAIAQEQRELGEFEDMQATLESLLKAHPDGEYAAEALLVLGDHRFDQGDMPGAAQAYKRILSRRTGTLQGLAHYKLAWVEVNQGDCKSAFTEFEKAIDASAAVVGDEVGSTTVWSRPDRVDPEFAVPRVLNADDVAGEHSAMDVQREALVDLTYCYATVRPPDKAAAYLRERANSKGTYVAALSRMASRFAIIEQPRGAADVTRELLRVAPDEPARLDDARLLHSMLRRMEDYSRVGEDVELILAAYRRQRTDPHRSDEERAQLAREFEVLARDLATRAQRMGQEGGTSDWTKTPVVAAQTTAAYEAYLDTFDHVPEATAMTRNLADALWEEERFLEAGHFYRQAAERLVVEAPPAEEGATEDGELILRGTDRQAARIEALYSATVAYQRALEEGEGLSRLDRALGRAGLRAAGADWLAEAPADPDKLRRVQFSIARTWYDQGDWLRAADLLTAVAYAHPGTEQGDAAVHLVLDAHNTAGDLDGLLFAGSAFLAQDSPISAAVKAEIRPVVDAAQRQKLDDLSLAASGARPGGMEELLAFADRHQGTELGEKAILGPFVAARAAGDAQLVYRLGEQYLERFPDNAQAAGVASTLGQVAATRYELDRALRYLDQAAARTTDARQAVALRLTVGELRENLGDPRGAQAAFEAAMQAAADPRSRGEASAKLADLLERQLSPVDVVRTLEAIADPGDPEVAARLGLALLRTGRPDEAEGWLRIAVDHPDAGAGARARAQYGLAELLLGYLEPFEPMPDLSAIEELNGFVELALDSYLAAVRQPEPAYAQAALARLARAAEIGAEKLDVFPLPPDLPEEDAARLREALGVRADQLRAGRDEALAKCATRARSANRFDAAGRACLDGVAPKEDPIEPHPLAPRRKVADPPGLERARDDLARDPDDPAALREAGKAFLEAGDAHVARLVYQHLATAGGGPDDLYALGQAAYGAGDTLGALDAFGKAAAGGSQQAQARLKALYAELGVPALAQGSGDE